jgi:hypothetical protein
MVMLKRRIVASFGLTWGVLILLHGFLVLAGGMHGTAAYKFGQSAAWVFGAWLVYVSGRTLIQALNRGTGPSPSVRPPRSNDDRAHDAPHL